MFRWPVIGKRLHRLYAAAQWREIQGGHGPFTVEEIDGFMAAINDADARSAQQP